MSNTQAQKRYDELVLKMRLDKTARTAYNLGRFYAIRQVMAGNDLQVAKLWFMENHNENSEYLRGFLAELELWT